MEAFNFDTTVSASAERRIQRWFFISISTIVIALSMVTYLYIQKLTVYRSLCVSCSCCANTDADHSLLMQRAEELQTKEKELQEKLAVFSQQKQIAQQTIERFKSLATVCGSHCHMQSFAVRERDVQMTVAAASVERVSQMLASLMENKAFSNLILVAMQPKDTGYLFTIKDRC